MTDRVEQTSNPAPFSRGVIAYVDILREEIRALRQRRAFLAAAAKAASPPDAPETLDPTSPAPTPEQVLPEATDEVVGPLPGDDAPLPRTGLLNVVGLSLSGGGVRSASFCLGVLQALDCTSALKRVDYLSTVSGGGYIGSTLSAAMSRDKGEFPFSAKLDQDEIGGSQTHSELLKLPDAEWKEGPAQIRSHLLAWPGCERHSRSAMAIASRLYYGPLLPDARSF